MENDIGRVVGVKMDRWIKMSQVIIEFIDLFDGWFFVLASSPYLTHDAVNHDPMPGVKRTDPFFDQWSGIIAHSTAYPSFNSLPYQYSGTAVKLFSSHNFLGVYGRDDFMRGEAKAICKARERWSMEPAVKVSQTKWTPNQLISVVVVDT